MMLIDMKLFSREYEIILYCPNSHRVFIDGVLLFHIMYIQNSMDCDYCLTDGEQDHFR